MPAFAAPTNFSITRSKRNDAETFLAAFVAPVFHQQWKLIHDAGGLLITTKLAGNQWHELGDFDAVLLHRVAVAKRDGVEQLRTFFAERIEIHGDAPRRALFILIPVTFADVAAVVPFGGEVRLEQVENLPGFFDERRFVAEEREDGDFDRRDARGKLHDDAGIAGRDFFLGVGGTEQCETNAVNTGARLDDVRNIFFFRFVVEIFHALAGEFLVLAEVEVAAGGNAFEFLYAKREGEHHVHAGAGVVGEFLFFVLVHAELVGRQADGFVPLQPFCNPGLVPVGVGAGLDEELQFHLLEFPAAEGEVARVNFVAKRLADLRDAERNLLPGHAEDVLELNKNHLGGFRAEVDLVGIILYRAGMGLEHEIELPGLSVVVRAAFGAFGFR